MDTRENVDVELIMNRAAQAAAVFSQLDQKQTDRIVRAVYEAGFNNRVKLARMAYEETGLGVVEDKVMKNVVATQIVYEGIRDMKTVGIISDDKQSGIVEIAQPLGPIFAVIPMTNPTSTVLFKILIAMKTRNPIIIRPHHRAARSSIEAARICYEAALKEDAPEHCIQWVGRTTREQTHALMAHRKTALVLATGCPGLVKAAYSSGTPAIGVGAGNVPVFIESSADVEFAVEQIVASKTFDNGTVCASEQAVVAEKPVVDEVIEQFKQHGAYFLSEEEIGKVEPVLFDSERGTMKAEIVGRSARTIAERAGISVPEDTRRRMNERFMNFDASKYMDESIDARKIERMYNRNF